MLVIQGEKVSDASSLAENAVRQGTAHLTRTGDDLQDARRGLIGFAKCFERLAELQILADIVGRIILHQVGWADQGGAKQDHGARRCDIMKIRGETLDRHDEQEEGTDR